MKIPGRFISHWVMPFDSLKEDLIKVGLNFSREKIFRFKAQITEYSLLYSKFGTQKLGIFALKKQFMT